MLTIPTRRKLFLWLSLLLLLSDAVFVWINFEAEQARFQHYLEERAGYLQELFDVELDNTALSMQQTAAFIASTPDVQLACEKATSFRTLLELIEKPSHARFAVLLSTAHLSKTYFPDRLEKSTREHAPIAGWYIEESLHPEARELLSNAPIQQLVQRSGTMRLYRDGDGRYVAFTAFPLRDYLGRKDADHPAVGSVLAWFDVHDASTQLRADLLTNIAYAVGAFVLIEILLFLALRAATQRLENIITNQTATLREKAVHDELTGLYNRHYLDEFVHKELASAARHHRTICVAMMDMDHFQSINDRHGHLAGDQILADAAHMVRSRLRVSDLAFRYGGEEFLLIFSDTSVEQAARLCEALRQKLQNSQVGGLAPGDVTASFGVTVMRESGEPLDALLQRADRALYLAKDGGCNRVEVDPRPVTSYRPS